MVALPTTLLGTELLGSPAHHTAHNLLHDIYNKMTGNFGVDALTPGYASAFGIDLFHGSLVAPNKTPGVTFRITRDDLFTVAPDLSNPRSVYNPAYYAGLQVSVRSQVGNIVQPTGIWSYVVGHAQVPPGQTSGAYVLPFYSSAVHTSGGDGGALGYQADVYEQVASVTVSAFAFAANVTNATGIDMTALQKRGGGLDLAVGGPNIAGNVLQIRTQDAGAASLLYGTGLSLVGLDLSAFDISGLALNAQSTGATQALFRNKGTGRAAVSLDVKTAGQQAVVDFSDAGVTKFSLLKDGANNFFLYDNIRASAPIIVNVANGELTLASASIKMGFFGSTGAVKQTITGSKAGATATVLGSLLTALAAHGLIVDSTT